MRYSKFVVYNDPYCVWDWDLDKKNMNFIESMRPQYFDNVVSQNRKLLNEKERNLAALSIRLAYFHGMETFFSLACATLQAPDCVVGWLQKYTNGKLRQMVTDISNGKEMLCKIRPKQMSWKGISNAFNSFSLEDKEKEQKIKLAFGELWERLAREFQDEKLIAEYNSLKHGFRVSPGGFQMAFGVEKEYGVPPPSQNFHSMGGSEFGSSFYTVEDICAEGTENRKFHFRVKNYSVNWNPITMGIRVHLLGNSIQNTLSFLKINNGAEPKSVQFHWPKDLNVFNEAWKPIAGALSFNADRSLVQQDIQIFTREEILATYRNIGEENIL